MADELPDGVRVDRIITRVHLTCGCMAEFHSKWEGPPKVTLCETHWNDREKIADLQLDIRVRTKHAS